MATLLLLAAMLIANSLANTYVGTVTCDGSQQPTRYCYIDNLMGPRDVGYYKLTLIRDDSPPGHRCVRDYYFLQTYNNRPALRVDGYCHGRFRITVKNVGYAYKGKCGQNNGLGFKIIAGRVARACTFPWMAYVSKAWTERKEYMSCGGSIVGDRWILTAAHCLISEQNKEKHIPPASAIFVRTGSLHKLSGHIERRVESVYTHPEYAHNHGHQNDIALLKLKDRIKFDGCHAPVCINSDVNIPDRKWCIISGWGHASTSPTVRTNNLLWAYDYMLKRKECDAIYKSYSTDRTVCGRATADGNSGFCMGDSGGPLVCKDDGNGRYYQHGIVSLYHATRPCKMEGLYTKVSYYYDWIMGYIQ